MEDSNDNQQALPGEREYVQFIIAGHRSWMVGVFTERCFKSRWATYLPQEVSAWRKLDAAPQEPPPARTASESRYWSDRPMRDA